MPVYMTGNIDRVGVVTSVQRRRRWSAEEKAAIVQGTYAPGMSVSLAFLGFSYGFRPRPSQHDALDTLIVGIISTKVNWRLFRFRRAIMAPPFPQAPDQRSAHDPPDPEMAQGGRSRRRGRDGQRHGDGTRLGGHSLNAKGNFRVERTIVDWRSGFVLDLRRKR